MQAQSCHYWFSECPDSMPNKGKEIKKFELIASTVARVELKDIEPLVKDNLQEFVQEFASIDNVCDMVCVDDILGGGIALDLKNPEEALLMEMCKEARTNGFTHLEFDWIELDK